MLCDFGLAAAVGDEMHTGLTTSGTVGGSTRWCSPEVIDGGKRTTASDVWSWAMLVVEVSADNASRAMSSPRSPRS